MSSLIVLRLIHIVAGMFWVGAILFVAGFLLPSLPAIGPAAGVLMDQVARARRLTLWMMTTALLTVFSGVLLYSRDSDGFSSAAWLGSGPGRTFGLGGILAIVTVVVGMGITSPTARRMGALGGRARAEGRAPTPDEGAELDRLRARLMRSSRVQAVLLVLTAAAMAVARYVP